MMTLEQPFDVLTGKPVMPRKLRLTWQPGVKGQPGRWKKIYKKKAYYFDGGRGKSDHEAYDKAYAEWEKRKAKIDAESPKQHHAEYERTIAEWEDVLACSHQCDERYMAETAARKLVHLRKNHATSSPPPVITADTFAGQFVLSIRDPAQHQASQAAYYSALFGNMEGQQLANVAEGQRPAADPQHDAETPADHAEPLTPDALKVEHAIWQDRLAALHKSSAPSGDTLKVHADKFLAHKAEEAAAGQISKGRLNNLQVHLRHFVEWAGHGKSVDDINSQELLDYRSELLKNVKNETWAGTTAKETLATVLYFVRRLSEIDAIDALPKIMQGRSRALTISVAPSEIVVFEKEEITTLLSQASDRTKLYILLMLNCGMTQKDIADQNFRKLTGRLVVSHANDPKQKRIRTCRSLVTRSGTRRCGF